MGAGRAETREREGSECTLPCLRSEMGRGDGKGGWGKGDGGHEGSREEEEKRKGEASGRMGS